MVVHRHLFKLCTSGRGQPLPTLRAKILKTPRHIHLHLLTGASPAGRGLPSHKPEALPFIQLHFHALLRHPFNVLLHFTRHLCSTPYIYWSLIRSCAAAANRAHSAPSWRSSPPPTQAPTRRLNRHVAMRGFNAPLSSYRRRLHQTMRRLPLALNFHIK